MPSRGLARRNWQIDEMCTRLVSDGHMHVPDDMQNAQDEGRGRRSGEYLATYAVYPMH